MVILAGTASPGDRLCGALALFDADSDMMRKARSWEKTLPPGKRGGFQLWVLWAHGEAPQPHSCGRHVSCTAKAISACCMTVTSPRHSSRKILDTTNVRDIFLVQPRTFQLLDLTWSSFQTSPPLIDAIPMLTTFPPPGITGDETSKKLGDGIIVTSTPP